MSDPQLDGTVLENVIPTDAEWEEAEQITCPGPHKYFLDVNINSYVVPMLIDSGSECTFINQNTWCLVGKPKLCSPLYESLVPGGGGIKLQGEFFAKIEHQGRTHNLPVLVVESMTSCNVMGLTWLSHLKINWNAIFHEKCIPNKNCFYPAAEDLEMAIAKPSVEIVMNGIPVKITIDTGATNTIIDLPMWEKIGCPTLIEKPVIQTVSDFNGKQIEIRGEAMIRVCYQGQMAILPALVANASLLPVIGTNWSTVIKFNFNAIFANIPRQNRQEPPSRNSMNHLSSKSVLNEPAVQNKIEQPDVSATIDEFTPRQSAAVIVQNAKSLVATFWKMAITRFSLSRVFSKYLKYSAE
jgi:hypothetical protein